MIKRLLVLLVIGSLLCCGLPPKPDFPPKVLEKVEFCPDEGFGSSESWVLTFEDKTVITVYQQPEGGFKVGEGYYLLASYWLKTRVVHESKVK